MKLTSVKSKDLLEKTFESVDSSKKENTNISLTNVDTSDLSASDEINDFINSLPEFSMILKTMLWRTIQTAMLSKAKIINHI